MVGIKKTPALTFLFLFADRFRRSVLPPEEDHPPRLEGREPAAGRRDEHQDRRLRIQQRVHSGQQTGHLLRESALRCARAFPG